MFHVDESNPALRTAAGVAVALALLAGCTDPHRTAPLMSAPAARDLAPAAVAPPARMPSSAAFDAAVRSDAMPPATTGVSLGASRRT
ncbi:MAG: hypothetical protein U1F48_00625 [Burkholderiales bacterium]